MVRSVEFEWTYTHRIGGVHAFDMDVWIRADIYQDEEVVIREIVLIDDIYESGEDGKRVKTGQKRWYLSDYDTAFDKVFANHIRNALHENDDFVSHALDLAEE